MDEEGEDFLRRIRSSAQHMKRVLDDMCHIVKLLSRPVGRKSVDLNELVGELRLKVQYLLDDGGVMLEIPDDLPSIDTDPELLREALGALLKNAASFNDRAVGERRVSVSTEQSDDKLTFVVRDNGIGIDPRYLPQVFELGLKLDKSRGAGPGYGLFLARKAAQALGGDVTADSALGEGSTFRLTVRR
jgi:signal transduction histidine kinase